MKIHEVLTKAADLIEPQGAWTQGRSAANAEGSGVDYRSPKAVCWCLLGALAKVTETGKGRNSDYDVAENYLRERIPLRGIVGFNDDPKTTQKMVVIKLREVASAALSENL